MSKNETIISKFLSLVLRHQPEIIGIQHDPIGWVDLNELIEKASNLGVKFDNPQNSYRIHKDNNG